MHFATGGRALRNQRRRPCRRWRRRVGIEPTFRRFRAETTVLKTAGATRPHSPPRIARRTRTITSATAKTLSPWTCAAEPDYAFGGRALGNQRRRPCRLPHARPDEKSVHV